MSKFAQSPAAGEPDQAERHDRQEQPKRSRQPKRQAPPDRPAEPAGAASRSGRRNGRTGRPAGRERSGRREEEPRPEPLRFYGISWVDHSRHYGLRRTALTVGSALLTLAGVLLLWFCCAGLMGSGGGGWLGTLVVVALVLCTALAFTRAWSGYVRPQPADAVAEAQFRTIKVIGFVGLLLAYTLRSLVEAPGERLRRADYEAAVARYRRRMERRSGNPARRGR